jgi:3-hydroxymyristoyl/3-hydroxydecanoyl-(acyl carrier protein) dehydratase
MRHYWLDRITHLESGVRATGVKAVALAEDEFDVHFPGNPVLPGVFLLEGLAQTAGVLLHHSLGGRVLAVMVSIERARFLAFARPGDRVLLEVHLESLEEPVARVRGTARVDQKTLASARFTFRLVPPEKLIPDFYQGFWRQSMETWLGRHLELGDG